MKPPYCSDTRRLRAPRPARAFAYLLTYLLAFFVMIGTGCAGWMGSSEESLDDGESQLLIAALEASIARDRAALADLVTQPREIETDPLHDDAKLRELVNRLMSDTAALERLKAIRDAGVADS